MAIGEGLFKKKNFSHLSAVRHPRTFSLKNYLSLVPVVVMLVIQIPHLSIPYFWDEAWSYMVAIKKMTEIGPSLWPGAVPIDYCKGHPQLFYFISSLWMNLFPDSILYMRILALLISVGLLWAVFFGLKWLTNLETAIGGVLLLGVQSTFLAQSILVLPEMMLSLWLVIGFFSFIRNEYKIYAITGSLMILTKETSLIFAVIFVLCYFLNIIRKDNKSRFSFKNFLLVFFPILVYSCFLIMHKARFGVFFYSEHIGYINYNVGIVSQKIGSAFTTAFTHYGRLVVLLATLGTLIFLIMQRVKIKNHSTLMCLSLLIPAYLLFLGINFYSPRYTLSLTVLLIIGFSILFDQLRISSIFKSSFVLIVACVCLFYSLNSKRNIDIDLGYIEVVEVNQEMVKYCEENNFYNDPIAASFNMNYCLKDKMTGYLTGKKTFKQVTGLDQFRKAKYFIYETTSDKDPAIELVKSQFKLVKAFTNKHAWGYIYENPTFEIPNSKEYFFSVNYLRSFDSIKKKKHNTIFMGSRVQDLILPNVFRFRI
jgi:hypothetical protein